MTHFAQFPDTEDLIWRALKLAGVRWRECCEIGAGDGENMSNTAFLIRDHGFAGTMIERDAKRIERCRRTYDGQHVQVHHAHVTAENVNDFAPGPYDVLSIDIDGNDFWIWQALKTKPGVVVIEANLGRHGPMDVEPYDPDFTIRDSKGNKRAYGASVDALKQLGAEKGYIFEGRDAGPNLIFVAREL